MQALVVGCGYTGRVVIENLHEAYEKMIVIDLDQKNLARLQHFPKVEQVIGDGSDINVLLKAGIEGCTIFLAVTGNDHVNLMTALLAKKIFKIKRVICRLNDNAHRSIFEEHKLTVISPAETFAAACRDVLGEGIL